MLHLLADETIPEGISDIIFLPLALTLGACLIFYAGWWVENRLTKAPWKWIALAPVLYALYIGIGWMLRFQEPVYNSLVTTGSAKKMIAAHYGSVIIPILGLIAIVLFHFFNHKLNLDPDE